MKTLIKNQSTTKRLTILGFVLAVVSMFSVGCTSTPPSPSCSTANTLFNQIYTNVVATPGNANVVFMDLHTHGYHFTVSSNKTICSVGYRSQTAVAAQLYNIEIIDTTTSTTLYSGNHTFSATATSYVAVPNVSLVPGHVYTIRRTLTNDLGNIANTVGSIARDTATYNDLAFPFTSGALTVTGSFFGSTSNLTDYGLPYIDIAFQ